MTSNDWRNVRRCMTERMQQAPTEAHARTIDKARHKIDRLAARLARQELQAW
jgi:hypothetical protein